MEVFESHDASFRKGARDCHQKRPRANEFVYFASLSYSVAMAKPLVRRMVKATLMLVGLLVLVLLAALVGLRHPMPEGTPGPEAEALAHAIEDAVALPAWQKTGAVRWSFVGVNQHLWDRQRNLARVRWSKNEVLLDVARQDGRAFVDGRELSGEPAKALVQSGYKRFINDSFWLNPLAKLFDDGTSRARATVDGRPALIIHYASGGVTPGDTYVWLVDEHDRPTAWRLWVSVLPIHGLEFSWSDWVTLSTGAQIATAHRALGLNAVAIKDVAGAATLAELEPGADPFAPLAR
jgi:hypothetical protein